MRIKIFYSTRAVFYAPSDPSGIEGMYHEMIRAMPRWRHGPPHNDCVFVTKDEAINGFSDLHVARVLFFFSFTYASIKYPCELVQWFIPDGNRSCDQTGMWMVEPDVDEDGCQVISIIHLDCIVRGALLIPFYGSEPVPIYVDHKNSLSAYNLFYINKIADHHSNEIAF